MNPTREELVDAIRRAAGSEGWTRWERVAGCLANGSAAPDADLLRAWAELNVPDLIEQNRSQTSVRLSAAGHRFLSGDRSEPVEATAGHVRFWVYYNHLNRPDAPRRLILHRADCQHCDRGRGHGGHAQRVAPANSSRWLPQVAWIGPFAQELEATEWCASHRVLGEPPSKCSHCFPPQR